MPGQVLAATTESAKAPDPASPEVVDFYDQFIWNSILKGKDRARDG
jgi:hypothetical protein